MNAADWRSRLDALLAGPYAGVGGRGALARDLGVCRATVQSWLSGRRSPDYPHRQAIAALAKAHGLNEKEE